MRLLFLDEPLGCRAFPEAPSVKRQAPNLAKRPHQKSSATHQLKKDWLPAPRWCRGKVSNPFSKAFTIRFIFGQHGGKFLAAVNARVGLCPILPQADRKEPQQSLLLLGGKTVSCLFDFMNRAHVANIASRPAPSSMDADSVQAGGGPAPQFLRHPQCAPGTVYGLVFNGLGYLHEHEKMVPICDGLSALSARGRGLCNNPT